MSNRSFTVFLLAATFKLVATTWAALWPLHAQHALEELKTVSGLARLYTLSNSNLDVWLLSLGYTLMLVLLFWQAATPTSQRHLRGMAYTPPYAQVSQGVFWVSLTFQLFLMAKAVAVAVTAKEVVLPPRKPVGCCGLLCMYVAIVAALVASMIEKAAGQRLVAAGRRRLEKARESSLRDPLLGKGKMEEAGEGHHNATIMALLKLSIPDAPILFVAFSAGAAAALGQALIPYYTGRIIDYASIDPEPAKFRATTLKLLGVAAGCALFTGVRGGLFTICMTRLNVRLRTQLFAALMNQEIGFFDTVKTGDITSRLSADTTAVSDQISLNMNVMLRSLTQAAMVLAFMFSASWRLTVVTFIIIPCVLVICKVYGEYYRKISKKVQTELAEANSVAEEAISTMTTVKAHAAEDSTQAAYAVKLRQFYDLQTRVAGAYAAYMSTNTFLAATVVAVVLYYGGSLVLAGAMSAGSLVSFMLYQQSLSGAFQALGDVFSALAAAVGAADKVVELMHRRPRLGRGGTLAPATFAGKIALQGVHFSYPARPALRVLSGLSVTVQPGEIVALVGPSGGGKSSIVKLVERFYLPSDGRVLIDDREVGEYDPKWLKRHVALVSQEPVLYARSIRRNIIYGMEEEDGMPVDQVPTQQEIEEAARLANAHDFITALPDGYGTECGEKGVQLSGGQKQRIAIARALIRRPTVLLLDEATSALDADSEAVVQEALDRTMKNRTVLVIAHRLSTVQDAHRIVVVQHGSVAESGSHEELLEQGGVYSTLVRRQMARASSSASIRRAIGSSPSLDEIGG